MSIEILTPFFKFLFFHYTACALSQKVAELITENMITGTAICCVSHLYFFLSSLFLSFFYQKTLQ